MNRLHPGIHILDPAQPLREAERVGALLDNGLDHGPDLVVYKVWTWQHIGVTVTTTLN